MCAFCCGFAVSLCCVLCVVVVGISIAVCCYCGVALCWVIMEVGLVTFSGFVGVSRALWFCAQSFEVGSLWSSLFDDQYFVIVRRGVHNLTTSPFVLVGLLEL